MQTHEERRNGERLHEMDKMFELLRKMDACRKLTNKVYIAFQEELIQLQETQKEIQKLLDK